MSFFKLLNKMFKNFGYSNLLLFTKIEDYKTVLKSQRFNLGASISIVKLYHFAMVSKIHL